MRLFLITVTCAAGMAVVAAQNTPQSPVPPQQGPTEIYVPITIEGGAPPHYAVPDFLALTSDADTVAAAKTMSQVLWDDLVFEREFDLIPRDTYRTIPPATSPTDIPFDRWRELGADGVVIGAVQKTGTTFRAEMRLFDIRNRRVALGK